MQRIRKGDEVVVIAGRDKGRRGTVVRVLDDERIVVENINIAKKHQKPNPNAGVAGGIVEIEMPLDASNVMLCPMSVVSLPNVRPLIKFPSFVNCTKNRSLSPRD